MTKSAALLALSLPIAAQACNAEPYVGSICTFAFSYCPAGYVAADGRTLPVSQYQALFALLGFSYGGDNSTVFAIPDLRGRSAIGQGTGTGLQTVAMTQKVGQQSVTLTPAQTPLVPHTHNASFNAVTGSAQVTIPATPGNLAVTASLPVATGTGSSSSLAANQQGYLAGVTASVGPDPATLNGPYTTAAPGANAATLPATVAVAGNPAIPATTVQVPTVTGGTVTVSPAGANATQAVSTQSPAIAMSVCIAVTGLYPTRP